MLTSLKMTQQSNRAISDTSRIHVWRESRAQVCNQAHWELGQQVSARLDDQIWDRIWRLIYLSLQQEIS